MITALIIALLAILGAIIGSFTSVFIYRLHEKKHSIVRGRSMCPQCETVLKPLDLIPIASYLALRGKCRYCSKEISYMYPLLELVSAALFALLFLKFPFLNNQLQFSGAMFGLYALHSFYLFVLIFTFFFDLHYLKVADEILLPAILIALLATLAAPATPHFFDSLLGIGIGIAFFGIQYILSKGTWIGLGDLRVGAFMGAMLGWKFMLVALALSYFIGSAVSIIVALKKGKLFGVKIPFAPFLVTGTIVTLFWGNEILDWYLSNL